MVVTKPKTGRFNIKTSRKKSTLLAVDLGSRYHTEPNSLLKLLDLTQIGYVLKVLKDVFYGRKLANSIVLLS